MNVLKKIFRYFKCSVWHYGMTTAGLVMSGACFADAATDPLKDSIKPEITALFGAGSTVSYAIYIGEVILGTIGYIKTKNPMVLIGVPIVVLFTHSMFQYVAS